jgi:hypothetical protein
VVMALDAPGGPATAFRHIATLFLVPVELAPSGIRSSMGVRAAAASSRIDGEVLGGEALSSRSLARR